MVRRFLDKHGYYLRLAAGLTNLLRRPPHSDPAGLVRESLESRERNFLATVQAGIFQCPGNPYREMFRIAGCRFEDLAGEVKRNGLESALAVLHREGVYLSHDEFKGKVQIVRSGQHIPSYTRSFVNPLQSGKFETSSGGSRSGVTRTRSSVARSIHIEAYTALTVQEFGLRSRVQIHVRPILPAGDGLFSCLQHTRLGCRVDRWFSLFGQSADSAHYRTATNLMVSVSWLFGQRIPFPSYLPPSDFSPVAKRLARHKAAGVDCMVGSYVSPAARVAAAAMDLGLDIGGTLFLVGGEPLTDGKRRVIESAGGRVFARYWINEVGPVGFGCRQMTSGNCVHLFEDSLAAITHRRTAPLSDVEVDSLLFTNLLPSAPFLLINAEMDDSGILEPATCECAFSAAGLRRRVRDISSFGKLTGHGVTLLGTDIVRILEEALPARFGGRAGDYQLVEREDRVQTQLTLRVSPQVVPFRGVEIRSFFLSELRRYQGGASASRVLERSEALEVVHAAPLPTQRGKILLLHLLNHGGVTARES